MKTPNPQLYTLLTAATIGLLLLLILLGAAVRVTDAEEGCNRSWPLCDGELFPPLNNHLAWLDQSHRFSTALTGVFMLGVCWLAHRHWKDRRDVAQPAYLSMGLFGVQSLVGAGTAAFHWESALPLVHMGFALIMLSCLVASLTALRYQPGRRPLTLEDTFPKAVYSATLMIFMVLMTGAIIVGSRASTACPDWSLCVNPQSDAAYLPLIHRGGVLLLGVILLTLFWRAWTERRAETVIVGGVGLLLGLYALQGAIGGLYVVAVGTDAARGLSALHMACAGLMWAVAVALSVIMTKQQTYADVEMSAQVP